MAERALPATGFGLLMHYNRRYNRILLLGSFYALIGASASAFSPFLLGRAVDDILLGVQPARLGLYALGLLALAATLAVFRYLLRMLTGGIAADVSYRMGRDLFDAYLRLDRATRLEYGVGDLLSRSTNDFIAIWRFYSAGFQMSIHSLFLLLIGTVLMALSSPLLALLVLLMLSLSLAAQAWLGRVLAHSYDRVQRELANLSAFVQEHVTAARMLAAFSQETAAGAAFEQANRQYTRRSLEFALRNNAISPMPSLVVRLATALVLAFGGLLIVEGRLTIGAYVQFIAYLGLLSAAAQQFSQAFERLQQGIAAAQRVGELLRRRPAIIDRTAALDQPVGGTITFEHVSLRAGNRWALHDISLSIPAGTTLGIVGATGAGKSSLLSLIPRLRDPDEGRVLIDGIDLRHYRLARLREAVAMVPQEALLFTMSLADNIALGLQVLEPDRLQQAVEAAALQSDLAQLPQGLETLVGERGATLSGGQKQRAALARALLRKAPILLLDDALASVDTQTAARISEALGAAGAGRTCLIVSQRIAPIKRAEQIIVLEEGRIAEQGTHQSLLARGERYAAMYRCELQQAEEELV